MELNPETFSMENQIFPVWEWGHALEYITHSFPWRYRDFALASTERQYRHKCNLIENLSLCADPDKGMTFWILGSWYGHIIIPLITHYFPNIIHIVAFDFDPEVHKLCWSFNKRHNDIILREKCDVNFDLLFGRAGWFEDKYPPDIIINTACEHMYYMKHLELKHTNPVLGFQTNNYDLEDAHVNCCNTLEEFQIQSGMNRVLYKSIDAYAINYNNYGDKNNEKYKTLSLIGYQK
jgi:hypothetical protein